MIPRNSAAIAVALAVLALGLSTPAHAVDPASAEASFEKFAKSWVADLERHALFPGGGAVGLVASQGGAGCFDRGHGDPGRVGRNTGEVDIAW